MQQNNRPPVSPHRSGSSSEYNRPLVSPHQTALSSEYNKPTDHQYHHTNQHYPASATNQQTTGLTTPITIIQRVQQTNRPPVSPHQSGSSSECNRPPVSPHQSALSSECNKPTDHRSHHTVLGHLASTTNQQTIGVTTPNSIIQRVQQTNRPLVSPHRSGSSIKCNKPTDHQYHHTNQHHPASATNQPTTGLTTPIRII